MTHQAKLDELETRVMDLRQRKRSDATPSTRMAGDVAERAFARAVFDLLKRDHGRIERFMAELHRLRASSA